MRHGLRIGWSAVWSLAPADIAALNAGASARVRFSRVDLVTDMTLVIAAPGRLQVVEGRTDGGGFAEAVRATLK